MRFFEGQDEARRRTRNLLLFFALAVLLVVLAVNAGMALSWWAISGIFRAGSRHPEAWSGYPGYFFEVNTGLTLLLVLGGWWIESSNLHGGGERLARRAGAREARPNRSADEQRYVNVVQELSIAAGMKPPLAMVIERSAPINAFAAGWTQDDAVIAVTRDALELLTREEMQGIVAHELSHISEGDTRLNMRLAGMVFGLEMVSNLGRNLREGGSFGLVSLLPGIVVEIVGWVGWLAGQGLKAAVSREREFLADARAVQWTRSRDGLGGVLRKVLSQQRAAHELLATPQRWLPGISHMLLVPDESGKGRVAHWLDSHPSLEQRIRRIYGRDMGPIEPVMQRPVGVVGVYAVHP